MQSVPVRTKVFRSYPKKGLNSREFSQVKKLLNKQKLVRRSRQSIATQVGTTGQLTELTLNTEGDDRNNRLSDEIMVYKLRCQMAATISSAASDMQIRFLIVLSRMGPLVLGDFPSNTLVLPDYDKFVVYYDRTFRVNEAHGDVNIDFRKSLKTKKIPGVTVGYDDDESTTAAQRHPIYFFTISSDNTNAPSYMFIGDIYFYDKN